jgi:hypothetical protein
MLSVQTLNLDLSAAVKSNAFIQLGIYLAFGIALFAAALIAAHLIRKRMLAQVEALKDLSQFTPAELERLIQKGLLSDAEARQLQGIIAQKAIEALEKRKHPVEDKMDPQRLLAEAQRLQREHALLAKQRTEEQS